jgi:hypothetical protein
MYINAMTETGDNTYLTKSTNGLSMIAYELERILDDEDRKDLPGKHTKELKAIRTAINNANGDERHINHLFKTSKQHIELKNGAFRLVLEKTNNNHLWFYIEYTTTYIGWPSTKTYTSIIEHINDID